MTIEELFEKSGKEYLAFDLGDGLEMLSVEQLKQKLGGSIPVELPVKHEIADKSLQKYLDNAKRLCEIVNESHKITQEMLDQKF